jgi:hypothetical protein
MLAVTGADGTTFGYKAEIAASHRTRSHQNVIERASYFQLFGGG